MAEVPLAMNKLEEIAFQVAQELLEQWAINDRFNEDQIEQATQNSVDDTIFVINRFMEEFNTHMLVESEQKSSLVLPE